MKNPTLKDMAQLVNERAKQEDAMIQVSIVGRTILYIDYSVAVKGGGWFTDSKTGERYFAERGIAPVYVGKISAADLRRRYNLTIKQVKQ